MINDANTYLVNMLMLRSQPMLRTIPNRNSALPNAMNLASKNNNTPMRLRE